MRGAAAPAQRPVLQAGVVWPRMVTPHMRRITFAGLGAGPGVESLAAALPGAWLKVVLPAPEGGRPASRAYTIRRFDPAAGTLDIDFVLHGDGGPASAWAGRARPGDQVGLAGPRGGHRWLPGVPWRLLAGDETALPAIAALLEAAPADAPVLAFIEVPSDGDVQDLPVPPEARVHWLPRTKQAPGTRLLRAVRDCVLPPGAGQAVLAGEAAAVAGMKAWVLSQRPAASVEAKGYWSLGQASYKDRG